MPSSTATKFSRKGLLILSQYELIVTELRRISNRLQMLSKLCGMLLIKAFPQDSDVMEAIKTLQSRLEEAEGEK